MMVFNPGYCSLMHSKYNFLLLASCSLLAACGSALYLPTQADALRAGSSTDSLMTGRSLYISHCDACHNLYLPEKFSQKHWEKEIPEMAHKAKITQEEARLISIFVLAHCK